jgi:hypothetical protein
VDNAYHSPTSIHAQQLAILLREARDVAPRQAWQRDIIESIHVLQAQKVEVVIAGDFNTAEITRGTIKEICTQCNLEVISHASNGFSSYKQGKKCIDHILGSVKIAQAVTLMCYEDYPAEYYSDHTPMFLQINLDTLKSSYGIGKLRRKRRLYSKDHENVRKYVLHKTKLCQQYQISKKIGALEEKMESPDFNLHSQDSELINTINDIDVQLDRISLEAEIQIKPRGNRKWSQDAIQCQKECVTMRYHKQLEKKRGNFSAFAELKKQIQQKSKELDILIQQQSNFMLKKLKHQLKEIPALYL